MGELEALVSKHPLRAHLRGLLMLALYRAGRQAEALEAYRAAHRILVDELGLEPSQPLQELERAILQHDSRLEVGATDAKRPTTLLCDDLGPEVPERSILLISEDDRSLDAMIEPAIALASQPPRELILARLVPSSGDVRAATASLGERRESLLAAGKPTRVAAFTSSEPGRDTVLLASEQPTDLVLLDAPTALVAEGTVDDEMHIVLADVPCDVHPRGARRRWLACEPTCNGPVQWC